MRKLEFKVPGWEKKLSIGLEILIAFAGINQTFFGDIQNGILILICLAAIVFPRFFTKNLIRQIPIEIEILLFLMVYLQYVLGGVHDFYNRIPYYDKLVHFMLPMFIGLIGFLIAFTMYATGRLKTSPVATVILVALLSLGVGALWEIFEYSSDVLIYPLIPYHHFQGNLQQTAINDTMTDLIDDFLGGIFGAVLGLIYMRKEEKSPRLHEFVREMAAGLFKQKTTNH